jgi:hypothetical protein
VGVEIILEWRKEPGEWRKGPLEGNGRVKWEYW